MSEIHEISSKPGRRSRLRAALTTSATVAVLAILGALLPAIPASAAGLGMNIDVSRPRMAKVTVTHPGAPSITLSARPQGGAWQTAQVCSAPSGQVLTSCTWGFPMPAGTFDFRAQTGSEEVIQTVTISDIVSTVSLPGDGSAVLTVTNPANSTNTSYRLRLYDAETETFGSTITAAASGGTTTDIVLPRTNFVDGHGYIVELGYDTTVGSSRIASGNNYREIGYPRFTAPRDVRITLPNNSISIGLTPPAVSPTVLNYRFRYRLQGTTSWTIVDTDASSGRIGTVPSGYRYEFTVTTLNVVNGVKYEHGTSPIVVAAPFGPPDDPQLSNPVVGNRVLTVQAAFPTRELAPSVPADAAWELGSAPDATTAPTWASATPTVSGNTYSFAGLVAGTFYSVRVKATNEAGASQWVPLSTGTQMTGSPDAPSVTAGEPRDGGVALSVTVPQSAGASSDGLRFQVAPVTNGVDGTYAAATAATVGGKYVITGLTNGSDYRVRVLSYNGLGDSGWGYSTVLRPIAAPAAPSIAATRPADGSVALDFTAPTSDASPVTSLRWEYQISGSTAWATATATPSAAGTVTIGGLTNGTGYRFRVTAVNGVGTTSSSASAIVTPIAAPLTPSISAAAATADSTVVVDFLLPSSSARPATAVWEIATVNGGVVGGWSAATPTVSGGRATFTGLATGATYRVRLTSTNSSGSSSPVTSSDVVLIGVPAAPTLTGYSRGDGWLEISATFPSTAERPSQAADARFSYTVDDGGSRSWRVITPTYEGGRFRFEGLANGTSYIIRVHASNAQGLSLPTDSASLMPAPGPAKPAISSTAVGDGRIDVTLSPVQATSSFTLDWETSTDGGVHWNAATASGSAPYSITGLTNGTAYIVRVRVNDAGGTSDWTPSSSVTPVKVPATPVPVLTRIDSGFRLAVPGLGTVEAPVVRYEAQIASVDSGGQRGPWVDLSSSWDGAALTITSGVQLGTDYVLQVRAHNAAGPSLWGSTTPTTAIGVPVAPASATLNSSSHTVWVSTTAVSSVARPVTSFGWELSTDGGETWTSETPTQTGSQYRFSGLTDGVDYTVRYRQRGPVGPGESLTLGTVRPFASPSQPTISSVESRPGAVFVRFDLRDRAAAPVHTVLWQVSAAGGAWQTVTTSTAAGDTTALLSGLTDGIDYRVRLQTWNPQGNSQPTISSSVRPISAPVAPQITALEAGDTRVTATLVQPTSAGQPSTLLQWQIAPSGTENWQDVNPTGTGPYVFAGLVNGVDQRVRVRAVNSAGESAWTTSATVRPITRPVAPLLSTVRNSSGTLTVDALFPTSDAAPAAGREWQIATVIDGVDIGWRTVVPTTTGTTNTFSGLVDGTDYRIRARSLAPQGSGEWATSGVSRPVHAPDAPIIGGIAAATGSLVVDVDFPSSAAAPSRRADAEWEISRAGGAWTVVSPAGTGSAVISGLTDGDDYRVRVRAVNGAGSSAWVMSAAATPTSTPAAPGLGNVVLHAAGFEIDTTGVDLSAFPGSALEWQISRVVPNTATSWTAVTPSVVDADTWSFDNLTNGSDYRVRVRVASATVSGPWAQSAIVRPISAPAAPVVTGWETGNRELRISAGFPSTDGAPSAAIDGRWEISVDSESPRTYRVVTPSRASDGSFVISGLTTGESYRVRVRSENAVGSSAWVDIVPTAALAAVPLTPSIDNLVAGNQSLTLRAEHPSTLDLPVTSRVWEIRTDGGSWGSVTPTTLSDGRYRFSGLVNGHDYQVRTRSVNSAGTSPWATSSIGRPIAVPAALTWTDTQMGDGSITLTLQFPSSAAAPSDPADAVWTLTSGSPRVSHRVYPSRVGDRYTVSGLVNGTGYLLEVAGANATGTGPSSAISFIPLGQPTPFTIDSVVVGQSTLAVAAVIDRASGNRVTGVTWQTWSVDGAGRGAWTTVSAALQSNGTYLISGLTADKVYQLRARGSNPTGNTPWVGFASILVPGSGASSTARTASVASSPVDSDGDGIANEYDLDVDGDGIPNADDADIDGDGIPNGSDSDMDGDGIANVSDPDIDGDGTPNAQDSTPAGPGSQPGDPGTGSVTDIDGDGIPNATDPDVDGDGIANVWDTDVDGDGIPNGSDSDIDGDGTPNAQDSTPNGIGTLADIDGDGIPNGSDPDMDGDGVANVSDPDIDGDGIPNAQDPTPAGPGSQPGDPGFGSATDIDGDGIPNASDPDVDGDGVANVFDTDVDGDGIPNASDPDIDGDGTPNAQDSTPNGIGTLADIDGDGIPNGSDADMDGDGVANVSDPDIDGDGIPNAQDPTPAGPGSQPGDPGFGSATDIDGDGIPNASDPDVDGDGIANVFDTDVDGDGIPNASDSDIDGDGTPNAQDSTPNGIGTLDDIDGDGIPNGSDPDMDGDGVANVSDPDIDGDGIPNAQDPTPAGPGSQPGDTGKGSLADIDGDGIPNASDPDVDGDGIANVFDGDVDGDGIPNASDPDIDGDGTPNGSDATPNGIGTLADIDGDGIPNESDADMDGDGVANVSDPDIDGDGIPNAQDPTPAGPGSQPGQTGVGTLDDIDGDGIPNAQDSDVDGDGIPNGSDPDVDGDGIPNGSDPDVDGDRVPNASDPDVDGDGIANVWDTDVDGDGLPNGSDPDADGDGVLNGLDPTPRGIGTEQDIDGDGIPNADDSDMDGDGRNNASDDDIDGDGIPNGSDTTPAGPGSQPGDTGLGSLGDLDGDGIPNAMDPDIDGDGINNVFDGDVDGDGIPNASDSDIDGDGIPNAQDATPNGIGSIGDIDGDGIPNETDTDVDGDGIPNATDPDIDGDGIPNTTDPDIDGDGIPNASDPTPRGATETSGGSRGQAGGTGASSTQRASAAGTNSTASTAGAPVALAAAAVSPSVDATLQQPGSAENGSSDGSGGGGDTASEALQPIVLAATSGAVLLLLLAAAGFYVVARSRRQRG